MPAVEIVDFHESKFWKPEKEFTEKLEAIGLKEINGIKELCLNFGVDNTNDEEIPRDLVIRGLNKLKEDGHISDFFDLGKFIKSARALGLKPVLQEDGNLSFIPSIVGKVVTMRPENPKGREVVNEAGEKRTYYTWVIGAVQGLSVAGATPDAKGTAPSPKVDASAMTEKWKEFLAENLTAPTNEAGIIKLVNGKIPDAAARKPYSETRKAALAALVTEGFLNNDEGKYSVA